MIDCKHKDKHQLSWPNIYRYVHTYLRGGRVCGVGGGGDVVMGGCVNGAKVMAGL